MSDAHIQDIVDAISDGERIDWQAVRRRLSGAADAAYFPHLETIEKIRQTAGEEAGPAEEVREPSWVPVLIAATIAQLAIAVVGFVAYRPWTFLNALRLLIVVAFGGVGLVLRQSRQNPRARDLGAVFLLRAFSYGRNPARLFLNAWLPGAPLGAVLSNGLALDAFMPLFMWRFARRFPATARFAAVDRAAIVITRLVGIAAVALLAVNLWALTRPTAGLLHTIGVGFEDGQRYSAIILSLALPALALILLRARMATTDERSRVRVFALAMVLGGAPVSIEQILEATVPSFTELMSVDSPQYTAIVASVIVSLLMIPFATAYSVLVHRMLDVRFVIRQGVRYLLARWTLALLTLAPFVLLASHVYARRHDSVVDVATDRRGLLLFVLVAVGGGLFTGRRTVMRALDRWFDRATADRTLVLARSGDALRLARTRSELVTSVSEAAERGLSASAAIHFYEPRRRAYVPIGANGLPLPAESALAAVLAEEPALGVLSTDRESSIARFLPRADRLWLAAANVSAIAPIRATGTERPAGVIAFGPRRDAIGYSREDEQFVTALASAAGIAFENLRLKSEATGEERDDEFGVLCERCQRVTDTIEGATVCPCGGQLRSAAVPRRINDKFIVEALLGAGGMGVAYLASDIALQRHVALKTLPAISGEAMARLGREARTMAALSHVNLATILGHESWRGTPILVCEYLHGGTLQQRLARGPLSVDEALTLTLTLLDALEYMHAQDVLHRDIKPSNIAFTSDRTPKLLDFGLAGLMEQAEPEHGSRSSAVPTFGTTLAGTVAYLPPQAFAGDAPTVQFDLWALAVVLFESIVGRHPFAAGADTAENICRGRLVASIEHDPHVPDGLNEFFKKALHPQSHLQFESSIAMRVALRAIRVASSKRGES